MFKIGTKAKKEHIKSQIVEKNEKQRAAKILLKLNLIIKQKGDIKIIPVAVKMLLFANPVLKSLKWFLLKLKSSLFLKKEQATGKIIKE